MLHYFAAPGTSSPVLGLGELQKVLLGLELAARGGPALARSCVRCDIARPAGPRLALGVGREPGRPVAHGDEGATCRHVAVRLERGLVLDEQLGVDAEFAGSDDLLEDLEVDGVAAPQRGEGLEGDRQPHAPAQTVVTLVVATGKSAEMPTPCADQALWFRTHRWR